MLVTSLIALLLAPKAIPDALDALVARETSTMHVPGMALGVVSKGRVVAERCYGLADLSAGADVTPESVFNLASLSKAMIASAVMLQVDAGKLGLDDPVSKHIEDTPPSWSGITVRELLSHTAGLARDVQGLSEGRPSTPAELLRLEEATPPVAAPDERFSYSNLGYFVLGEILTRTSGMGYAEFVERRLFRPIGMVTAATTQDTVPHRALGYRWDGGRYDPTRPLRNLRPSGAFIVSIRDMELWATEMLHPRVIPAADLQKMWIPARLRDGSATKYGFGWIVGQNGVVSHGGAQTGYRSSIRVDTRNDVAVVILTNSNDFEGGRLAAETARMFVGR